MGRDRASLRGASRGIVCGVKQAKKTVRSKTAPSKRTPAPQAKPAPARTPRAAARKPSKAAKPARRADFGAPIDAFFGKQSAQTRPILEALRELVEAVAPDAASSLKWGMPVYTINGAILCALAGHKAHVNLVLSGPERIFEDPDGLLGGASKDGRHLRLTALAELPRSRVRAWLKAAAEHARSKS